MHFRDSLTGIIFFALLIWGPVDHNGKLGMITRICYVVLIPLIIWLSLNWIWKSQQVSEKTERILNRILSGVITIALIVFALIEAFSINQSEGNSNWGNVFLLIVLAAFSFYVTISKGEKDNL